MTELSPAQKALAAFNERHELCGPFEDDWVEQCLAAVLETLADNLAYTDAEERQFLYVPEILAIAAELRGVTTTEPNS